MGWDNSRNVPWQRLIREWVIYASVMSAIFVVFFRGNNVIGAVAGVLISGPLYLAFGAIMAKFGYSRKTIKELRAQGQAEGIEKRRRRDESKKTSTGDSDNGDDSRPAPTGRTMTGSNRTKSSRKRKR
jgi:hypothetical protein